MRTARTKGARARFGASKVALGKILRGKLMPGFGVQCANGESGQQI